AVGTTSLEGGQIQMIQKESNPNCSSSDLPCSRDNSAIVFSPELIRPTVSHLNSAETPRRPSERRGNSPISHQPLQNHHRLPKVSSRNGEQSTRRSPRAL